MRLTLLGTGTSGGIPTLGCNCAVCHSSDPRDRRMRTSALVETAATRVLIDCGPDFRQQMLTAGAPRLDAIVLTHSHMDHILGLDDTRSLTHQDQPALKVYGDASTLDAIRRIYKYAFERIDPRQALPRWELIEISGPFEIGQLQFAPHKLPHFPGTTLAFEITPTVRSGAGASAPAPANSTAPRLCYATDCHEVPAELIARFHACDVLVLDMLRERKHISHLSLTEALVVAEQVAAKRTLFVHMNHEVSHAAMAPRLPAKVELGCDGLCVDLS